MLEISKGHRNNDKEVFREELDRIELSLPDGKKMTAPVEIDLTEMTDLDEFDYELWGSIVSYLEYLGIKVEDEGKPDQATVRQVQNELLSILIESGVNFKFGYEERLKEVFYEQEHCNGV